MVNKIRELCRQNKTSIAALERQLGFGNGVIGRWDKSVPNYDRLCAVANALGVSVSELTDTKSAKDSPADADTQTARELNGKDHNVIRTIGRDGSYGERKLTDRQFAAVLAMLEQLPDASEDL